MPTPLAAKRQFPSLPSADDQDDEEGIKKRSRGFKFRPIGESRRTNDEIHTSVELCPVTAALMDTTGFQRLRGIKQLGTADFVYMNTNGNRFEHSVGVSDLARRMISRIALRQPQLECTPKDILCVKLAGLLHDVGHGPFSHVFEQFQGAIIEYLSERPHLASHYEEGLPPLPPAGHETVSLRMIDHILFELGLEMDLSQLDSPLKQVGDGICAQEFGATTSTEASGRGVVDVLTTRDFVFIKECIWGKPVPDFEAVLGRGFHGRPPEKEFLYDIVCNQHCGLDVDKIDYYARDERRAFKGAGEIDFPMIEEALVAWSACDDPLRCHKCSNRRGAEFPHGKHLMVCYPQKLIPSCIDFFKKRFLLHTKIYSHKTAVGTSYMICDIFCAADPFFRLPVEQQSRGGNGRAKLEYDSLPISRAPMDPPTFIRCRDSVIDQIANTTDANLLPARQLIRRLWSHDLYKCAVVKVVTKEDKLWSQSNQDIKQGMLLVGGVHYDDATGAPMALESQDILIHRCNIHHGSKEGNPLKQMRFLEKVQFSKLTRELVELPDAEAIQDSRYYARLPRDFMETSIFIFSRDPAKQHLVRHVFEQWLNEMQSDLEMTGYQQENDKQGGIINNNNNFGAPAMLSQESGDEGDYDYEDDANGHEPRSPNCGAGCGQVTPVKARYP